MRILYLHQYFCPPGGAGNNRSLELARAWVAAGHKVTILTSTAYFPEDLLVKEPDTDQKRIGPYTLVFEVEGIHVWAMNVLYSHKMRFRRRVRAFLQFYRHGMRLLSDFPKPDIIYASSTPPTVGEMGRKLARRWKIPFVFETVDVWPDVPIGMGIIRNRLLGNWLTRRVNRIYQEAKLIIALSDGMKEQILSHGVSAEKVRISYNGTNLKAFPYQERLPREGLQVIYTGTVGVANDVGVLADVSKVLEQRGVKGIHFMVLGGGNDLERVKEKVKAMNVKNLAFVPSVPKEEVALWLSKADVGVVTFATFPVLEANSANKFYDYLASGLPIVINYQGWQAQYLQAWNCGLSSEMGNVEAFADNLIRLLNDLPLRKQMGQNGRKLAEERFDREQIAMELLKEFERTVSGGKD